MALSNIGNEPRREIIEQVVGTALFAIYVAADVGIVWWLGAKNATDWAFGIFFVGIGLPMAAIILFMLAVGLHGLGDLACDVLSNFGLDPRPKQRYRR